MPAKASFSVGSLVVATNIICGFQMEKQLISYDLGYMHPIVFYTLYRPY
jgi:hypothetical protein